MTPSRKVGSMTTSETLGTARPDLGVPDSQRVLPISQDGRFARWQVDRRAGAAERFEQNYTWRDRLALKKGQG